MNKQNDAIIEMIGYAIFFIGLPLWLLYKGLVLSYYWSWFVAPYFLLPQLGVLQAWGIAAALTYAVIPNTLMLAKTNEVSSWVHVSAAVFRPTFCLILGWIVSRFL